MSLLVPLDQIREEDKEQVGEKTLPENMAFPA